MNLKARIAALERRERPDLDHCRCPGTEPRVCVVEGEGELPAADDRVCDRCGKVQRMVFVRIVDRPACDEEGGLGSRFFASGKLHLARNAHPAKDVSRGRGQRLIGETSNVHQKPRDPGF